MHRIGTEAPTWRRGRFGSARVVGLPRRWSCRLAEPPWAGAAKGSGTAKGQSNALQPDLHDIALDVNGMRRHRLWCFEDVERARTTEPVVTYTRDEQRLIATHEAGPAVTAQPVAPRRHLEVLTIVKRGSALGLLAPDDLRPRPRRCGAGRRQGARAAGAGARRRASRGAPAARGEPAPHRLTPPRSLWVDFGAAGDPNPTHSGGRPGQGAGLSPDRVDLGARPPLRSGPPALRGAVAVDTGATACGPHVTRRRARLWTGARALWAPPREPGEAAGQRGVSVLVATVVRVCTG